MFDARVGKENEMGAIATRSSVRLGYAADAAGYGIVYARVGSRNPRILRAQFRASVGDDDRRDVGFAAVRAIAPALRKHLTEVELHVDDAGLIADLTQRRELPVTLLLPYVRARCALNSFKACELAESTGPNDLTARALAEVSIRIAA